MPGQFVAFPIDWTEPEVDNVTIEGDGTVATPFKVKDLGISTGKLAANAVTTAKITDLNVTTGKLAAGAVTTVKIGDGQVTLAKQASGTADRLQGFDASGNPSEISAGSGITISGGVISSTGGGGSLTTYAEASGVNANNRTTVRYETVSGSPVVDVVWTGEGGAAPTVSVNVTGGVILVKKVFTTYENTDATSRNLDITINGVGTQIDMAVPICQKVFHQFDFSTGAASSQLYLDNDNTPATQPFGYSSVSPGAISIRLTNIPSGERHGLNMIWQ